MNNIFTPQYITLNVFHTQHLFLSKSQFIWKKVDSNCISNVRSLEIFFQFTNTFYVFKKKIALQFFSYFSWYRHIYFPFFFSFPWNNLFRKMLSKFVTKKRVMYHMNFSLIQTYFVLLFSLPFSFFDLCLNFLHF